MSTSQSSSDSSDDEEYIPPANADEISAEEDDDISTDEEADLVKSVCKNGTPTKELNRDEIWEDFLKGEEKNVSEETAKSIISKSSNKTTTSISQSKFPKDTTASTNWTHSREIPAFGQKRPAKSTGDRLSDALKRLKSSAQSGGVPKVSTLDKSRKDWESFTKKEGITDDLKLHNKGKNGYIERKAFEARAQEREYQVLKEAQQKKFHRS